MRAGRMRGFTLLELMIVVAIIGLLAAIAIPAFMKYLQNAKSTEAIHMIQRISMGAREYYLDRKAGRGIAGSSEAPRFPATVAITPAITCCSGSEDKCMPSAAQWEHPSWEALHFSMPDPHYYRYEFISSGVGTDAKFTVRAFGDLDCDGILSTFETVGEVLYQGADMTGQAGIWYDKREE